ncbi:MAG: hypothetical protein IJ080_01570, partial [Oscillospiraceae bacterium]|nr:hypothetical protein [Oscillospiraceae bacterium]
MKKRRIAVAALIFAAMSPFANASADDIAYTTGTGTSQATNWLEVGISTESVHGNEAVYADKKGTAFTTAVPAADLTTEIKKVLVVPDDATIPECGFTFTATSGAAIEPAEGKLAVKAGITPEKIKWNLVKASSNAFPDAADITSSDLTDLTATTVTTTTSSAASIDYAANFVTTGVADADIGSSTVLKTTTDDVVIMKGDDDTHPDTYYAVKEFQLDFSECVFTEPGVYRYILTETDHEGKTNAGITNDTTRTLDVYVEDATYYTRTGTGTTDNPHVYTIHPSLTVSKYILYTGTVTAAPAKKDTADVGETPTEKFEDGSTRTGEY